MESSDIRKLVERYLNGEASEQERHLLQMLTHQNEDALIEVLNAMQAEEFPLHGATHDQQEMQNKIKEILSADHPAPAKVVPLKTSRRSWMWAASLAALLVMASVFFILIPDKNAADVTLIPEEIQAPESNRAMITLADGRTVFLDSVDSGQVVLQGNMEVVKLDDGQIIYRVAGNQVAPESVFNTLHNPRGSRVIDIKLSDGTHVWLNAGSAITYPVAFAGEERKVKMTGEAYFEVAHDGAKTFFVEVDDVRIRVTGTRFNVHAYDDETDIITTLLQGSVNVTAGKGSAALNPGDQIVSRPGGSLKRIAGADVEQVMAWKNGFFSFSSASLKEVMSQIARWYDVEVRYASGIPDRKFAGIIPRTSSLSAVLKILEETGVHFESEGRTITIK